jgi:hypothetical protein
MILSEVFILVAIGVAVSIPFARGTTRLVASFLYGVKPGDPLAITTAVGALATRRWLQGTCRLAALLESIRWSGCATSD